MPPSHLSLEKAFASAKQLSLPVLITYDIPARVVQDKLRKLVIEKKVIYVSIPEGGREEAIIKKYYQLDYLEGVLCDAHRNPLKNHMLDCDEMTKAVLSFKQHQALWDQIAQKRLSSGKALLKKEKYSSAAQQLSIFAYSHGGLASREGKNLFDQVEEKAIIAYSQWKGRLESVLPEKRQDLIEDFVKRWPSTRASQLAKEILKQKKNPKPFLGFCPISPKEVSVLKYRIEYQGQRYYMCCSGCLFSAKKDPKNFVARVNESKDKLTIKNNSK